MSSGNNHKRHTLEGEFQRRMHDAEASPAPDLWARIDHELTVQENKDYKKRVLFYRQLAAACFLLFAMTGALLAYHFNNPTEQAQPGIATVLPVTPGKSGIAPPAQEVENEAEAMSPAAIANTAPAQAVTTTPYPRQQHEATARPTAIAAARQPEGRDSFSGYYNAGEALFQLPQSYTRGGSLAGGALGANLAYQSGNSQAGRYSGIISESITITFGGSNSNSLAQSFQQQTGAEQPKSFLEMNEQLKAAREQYDQQQKQALAKNLNKEAGQKSEQATEDGGDSRWSLNLAYAPTYFDQNIGLPDPVLASSNQRFSLTADTKANATQESFSNMYAAKEEFEDKTEPAFSYTVEVKTGFKLKEKLKLLTGIGYSQSAARTKTNYIVKQFWVKPRTNERYELEPSTIFLPSLNNSLASDSISVAKAGDAFNVNYTYKHLSIPVGLQYESGINKDWFWYASGGVAANFLVESSISASNSDVQSVSYSSNDEESPFRNMQLSGNMSLGVGKRISDNLTVVLGPEFRNYFSTLVAEPDKAMAPQGKPYAFGLSMGVNYQLGSGRK
ncbi:outer membrane beta-barrel protein [Pontibacter roseus]|uniref:outer membrane beta-barrel protein n=1 Tax=Pontibacter roseus TaxID=336989 RepID=UPI0003815136|nr:outer membrane beta-barrel protein [Pontibacter roseus]